MTNILDSIKQRRSVRTFDDSPLSQTQRQALTKEFENTSCPFGGDRAFMRLISVDADYTFKPSTYGIIRGARDFCLLAWDSATDDMCVGYRFEAVVLKATEMGLGTCWIGATFRGTTFDTDTSWHPGDANLRIISPVGRRADSPSMTDRMARMMVKSNRRRPFDTLFFTLNSEDAADTRAKTGFFATLHRHLDPKGDLTLMPLRTDSLFGQSLEMARLAPSSTNSQPWRAVVDGKTVHFYSALDGKFSRLDCGIALYHFHATERLLRHKGSFEALLDAPQVPSWRYLTSYSL